MKTLQPFKIHPGGTAFVRGLSIRTKLFLGVGLIVFLLVVTCLAIIHIAFTKSFRAIQDQISVQRVESVILQLSLAENNRIAYAIDNAEWDDAFAFFEGRLPNFLSYNYASNKRFDGVQMVLAIDRGKNVIGRQVTDGVDPEEFSGVDVARVAQSGLLTDVGRGGLAAGEDGKRFIFAAHPVLRSDGTGPSPGWLVFVSSLDEEMVASIGELTGVEVSLIPHGVLDQADGDDEVVEFDDKTLGRVWAMIPDVGQERFDGSPNAKASVFFESSLDGEPVGIYVHLPSRLFTAGYRIQEAIRVLSLCAVAIFVVFCLIGFEGLVVRRVLALDADLQAVVDARDENLQVRVQGRDEIARVADTTNRMLSALALEHRRMVTQHALLESVLHSVGDGVLALTPVCVNGNTVDFQIATSNATAARYLEKQPNELAQTSLSELRGLGDPSVCISRCIAVMQNGHSLTNEVCCTDGNDSRWIRLSV